jgi:hypothetical protein
MQRNDELVEIWDQRNLAQAYAIDRSTVHDPSISFVFSDPSALRKIRFRHFMADFRAIEQPQAYLDSEIETGANRLIKSL